MKNEFEGEAKIGDLPLGRVKIGIDMASGPSRTVVSAFTRGQFVFSCTFTMDTSRRENRAPYIVRGNILYKTTPRMIPIGVAQHGIRDNRLRKFMRRGGLLVEVRARGRGGHRTLREAVEAALPKMTGHNIDRLLPDEAML